MDTNQTGLHFECGDAWNSADDRTKRSAVIQNGNLLNCFTSSLHARKAKGLVVFPQERLMIITSPPYSHLSAGFTKGDLFSFYHVILESPARLWEAIDFFFPELLNGNRYINLAAFNSWFKPRIKAGGDSASWPKAVLMSDGSIRLDTKVVDTSNGFTDDESDDDNDDEKVDDTATEKTTISFRLAPSVEDYLLAIANVFKKTLPDSPTPMPEVEHHVVDYAAKGNVALIYEPIDRTIQTDRFNLSFKVNLPVFVGIDMVCINEFDRKYKGETPALSYATWLDGRSLRSVFIYRNGPMTVISGRPNFVWFPHHTPERQP